MTKDVWKAEHMYFQRIIDQEIDKSIAIQKKAYSLHKLMGTIHNIGLFDGLRSSGVHRIESNEEWCDMGCPDAQFYFRAEYEVETGAKAQIYEILI